MKNIFIKLIMKFDRRVSVSEIANKDSLVISNATLSELKNGINNVFKQLK